METPRTKLRLNIVSAREIYDKNLPPTKWYMGEVLHEGACLLSGDPKVGKSFFALQIAIAVAGRAEMVFGSLPVHVHGGVLYLALDDRSEKRIHNRLHQLTDDEQALNNIDIVCSGLVPSLDDGLDQVLDELLTAGQYELLILDTLGAVSAIKSGKDIYQSEYRELIRLQMLAQKHNICLLILHHTNKQDFGNAVARSSGSHGRTGAVDSVLWLSSQSKGEGALQTKPRDGEESQLYLDRCENGGWRVREVPMGQMGAFFAPPPSLNPERQEVKEVLSGGPRFCGEIANALGLKPDTARKRLERMEADGLVTRLGGGQWADAATETTVRPVQVSDHPSGEQVAA